MLRIFRRFCAKAQLAAEDAAAVDQARRVYLHKVAELFLRLRHAEMDQLKKQYDSMSSQVQIKFVTPASQPNQQIMQQLRQRLRRFH